MRFKFALTFALAHYNADNTRWGKSMADDTAQTVNVKTDEALEGSISDDNNSNVNNGEKDEVVKTFKGLVSYPAE